MGRLPDAIGRYFSRVTAVMDVEFPLHEYACFLILVSRLYSSPLTLIKIDSRPDRSHTYLSRHFFSWNRLPVTSRFWSPDAGTFTSALDRAKQPRVDGWHRGLPIRLVASDTSPSATADSSRSLRTFQNTLPNARRCWA